MEHLAERPSKATTPLDPLQARVLKEDWDRLNRVPWYQVNGALADSLHPVLQERIPASLLEEGGWKLKAIHCELLAISSRAIEEATFNELVERMGNKSNLLTAVTLESIRQILHDRLDSKNDFDSIEIFCDKHGGRNRYVAALSHYFPDCWFEVVDESTAVSRYRSEMDGRSVRWSFTAKGDDMVPTSVASMLAKWTREAYMEKLNRFWSNLLPELRPTAGYPVDAKRFALEIESQARQLGFEKKSWWRMV